MIANHVRSERTTRGRMERDGNGWAVIALVAIGGPFLLVRQSFAQSPMGACCDPYNTECNAGRNAGERCITNADCMPPGTCEAVCRQTTEANCPFPPPDSDLRPQWQEGAACTPNPFGSTPCGIAACCYLKPNPQIPQIFDQVCENLSKNQCEAKEPLDKPRSWQLGNYCGLGEQFCDFPPVECGTTSDGCYVSHYEPGCCDEECCDKVCNYRDPYYPSCPYWGPCFPHGDYCCEVTWDYRCVDLASYLCGPLPPQNDTCAPKPEESDCGLPARIGAIVIPVPGSRSTSNSIATTDKSEPGFCCNSGPEVCTGGFDDGDECIASQDCDSGLCRLPVPSPGWPGIGTIWFKFTLPVGVTTAGIHTCNSNSPALDSILQVFSAGDHSSPATECDSLVPIACNDDAPNCSSTGRNSRLCLKGLTPGETYYIMVAAKTSNRRGLYTVSISTTCTGVMETCAPCPEGEVTFVDPPDGVVDARIPHKPNGPHAPHGIRSFTTLAPPAAPAKCWFICESEPASSVQIAAIIEQPPGTYRIELNKAISTAGTAFLSYRDVHGHKTTGRFFAHPANVNGDGRANAGDVLALIDHLNGVKLLPWGRYSGDIDRSGAVSPADILALVDLLNGTNGFAAWYGTALPDAEGCP